MSVPLELMRLLSLAPRARDGLQRAGPDWKCRCPSHRDAVSSLAIRVGTDGRLLLHCHAGCATKAVLDAWGVSWSVLFPEEPEPNGHAAASVATTRSRAPRGEPEATYDYVGEAGELLYQVVRFPGKDFRQRRLAPDGSWVWNLQHTRRVLYRLPELLRRPQEPVYLVEGEKDADRLLGAGLLATTAPMGAGKWRREYADQLRGRQVVLVPDNDEPGRKHAQAVAEALKGVAEVRVLELEGLDEHGDVSDWLDAGHAADELRAMAQVQEKVVPSPIHIGRTRDEKPGWHLVGAAEMLSEPDLDPPDLVAGMLPAAGLSIVGAKPKVGKSTLVRCLCLAVAQGGEWLGRECKRGGVIYLALEEKRREVIGHFRALGMRSEDPLHCHFGAAPQDALDGLAELIAQLSPALVVIDPLFKFTRVRDVSAYAEITNALGPVLEVARATGAHLLLVHHNTKMEREGGDDLLGSVAIFGAVDTALILRRRQGGLRYAYSIQRYGTDLEETVLELRDGLVVPMGSPDIIEVARIKGRVLEFLGREGEAAEPAIRENVEGKGGAIGKALRFLLSEGLVSRQGAGKRGDPFLYSLVTVAPTTPAGHNGEREVCPVCGSPEREARAGTGGVPSWHCLGCGQLYGQLPLMEGQESQESPAGPESQETPAPTLEPEPEEAPATPQPPEMAGQERQESPESPEKPPSLESVPRCPTCRHTVTVRREEDGTARRDDGWCQSCRTYVRPVWPDEEVS